MDRDNRWDRIEKSHALLTQGSGEYRANSAVEALEAAYARGEDDEFVAPTGIGGPAFFENGDAVLFMNFRADRARQLCQALVDPAFAGFTRSASPDIHMVATTEYAVGLPCPVAFSPYTLEDSLGEVLANRGYTQLRIAETEKYASPSFQQGTGRSF